MLAHTSPNLQKINLKKTLHCCDLDFDRNFEMSKLDDLGETSFGISKSSELGETGETRFGILHVDGLRNVAVG